MIKTNEGANAHEHSMNHALEFFSKAGSLYDNKNSFYGAEASAKELFVSSFIVDPIISMKLLFWLRDCRGGAGNRSGSRSIYTWLAENHESWLTSNMHQIPVYGRWDDLKCLFKTPLRKIAGDFWASAINGGDILSAKWAKRHYKPIRKSLGLTEANFRKLLANLRKNHIVEHQMCQKEWNDINYKSIPSVAMSRYSKTFNKHDEERFQSFKNAVKKGVAEVHADTLFPHDCIRTALHGDGDMAELQFNALPNFMPDDENALVLCDTSGSMEQAIGGSVEAIHVSMGMALYCSSRMPENSPFYKRFIGFCSESKFVDWRKHTFKDAIWDGDVFDRAIGSTQINRALDLILRIATARNIKQKLMPTTLLIVSDMQFSQGVSQGVCKNDTEIESAMNAWEKSGYKRPKIVYWNTAGYSGSQDTAFGNNVGLVSGFSPAICKAVFGGDDFSPLGIMTRALEKYNVIIPEFLHIP